MSWAEVRQPHLLQTFTQICCKSEQIDLLRTISKNMEQNASENKIMDYCHLYKFDVASKTVLGEGKGER